jgi:hypothetical protein
VKEIRLVETSLSCRLIDCLVTSIAPRAGDLEIKGTMDPPITKNSALYLAQKRFANRRSAFFRLVTVKGKLQPADAPRRTFTPPLQKLSHPDDGR